MSEYLAALREEVDPKTVLGTAIVLGILLVFTDVTWSVLVAAGIAFGLTVVLRALNAIASIRSRMAVSALFGLVALACLWAAITESSLFMGVLAVLGAWLALDTLHKVRYGIEPTDPEPSQFDEMGAGEAGRMTYRAGKVQQALDNSPASLSASELVTRTGLSEAEVREALSFLEDAEAVSEERERYELVERPGLLRSIVGRIVRPFSLFTPSR